MFCTLCLNDHGQGESCEASRQSRTATLQKIKIVKVEIPWGEGTSFNPRTFASLPDADRFLKTRAHEAPGPNGGYWKTDFVIHFADGETYEGTYSLRQKDSGFVNLIGRHVHNFAMFYAGRVRTEDLPSHLDAEKYQEIVAKHKHAQDYRDFLDKYELR